MRQNFQQDLWKVEPNGILRFDLNNVGADVAAGDDVSPLPSACD
jgi:hypothetical protein